MKKHVSLVVLLVVLVSMQQKATAQNTTLKGSVQRIKVHGKSLEGNLDGDHLNHIAERIAQKMLPFFTQHLSVGVTKNAR
jgi:hypothetical protein